MRVRARGTLHQPTSDGRTLPNFTIGREYVVCSVEQDCYRLVDDRGEPVLANADRFDVVDPVLPSWSVDDEDAARGPAAFLVPGFFERWHDRDARFRRLFEIEFRRVLADDESRNGPLPAR